VLLVILFINNKRDIIPLLVAGVRFLLQKPVNSKTPL